MVKTLKLLNHLDQYGLFQGSDRNGHTICSSLRKLNHRGDVALVFRNG